MTQSLKSTYEITLSDRMKFKAFSSRTERHITRTMAAVESEMRHMPTTGLIFETITRY
jgi:hypothetical protein